MVRFMEHCIWGSLLCVGLLGVACSTGFGRCPKLDYMRSFNLTKFSGQWFEIERSFYLMQVISSCVTVELAANQRNDQLEVAVTSKNNWSGPVTVSEGVATQTRKDPSVLVYRVDSKLPRIFNKYLPGVGNYQILDTDYKSYAILWSCTNYEVFHTDLIWIWGRKREINVDLRTKVYNILASRRLDYERLILPQNINCTEW